MASPSREDVESAQPYTIPPRRLGALEHPMLIKDLDKGMNTLGQNNAIQAVLDSASPQISVPLYLRYDNPTARPLTSHNALTHNVVLKVTVPKRTGRKRKRGTDGPWEAEAEQDVRDQGSVVSSEVVSRDRLDTPRRVRRKLQDNVGKYTVEPIGVINNTHRYRGLADFQFALGQSKFMSKFVDKVLPGDVAKLKEFSLEPGIDSGTNVDIIPPPCFTPMTLPFGYNYAQNPYTKELSPGPSDASGSLPEEQEYGRVVNVTSRVTAAGYFIAHDQYPVPKAPRWEPNMSDPQVAALITEMQIAMEERPVWTRRSMWNRLGAKFAELPRNLVRYCLQYAGYQFKGGPWRDALVKYGLDPRTDPKYRIYQTLIFKLHRTRMGAVGRSWQAVRRDELDVSNFGGGGGGGEGEQQLPKTHVFDGQAFSTDGKVWQVCDITDPLLAKLFAEADVRAECDAEISGFYPRVLWSVAKAIMKCKMLAIRFGRTLTDDDFAGALEAVHNNPNAPPPPRDDHHEQQPDHDHDGDGDGVLGRTVIGFTLPDLKLTAAEYEELLGPKSRPKPGRYYEGRRKKKSRRTHFRVRIPLKDAGDREAAKMIRMLTRGGAAPRDKEAGAVAAAAAAVAGGGEALRETAEGVAQAAGAGTGEEGGEEESELEAGPPDGGAFQKILDDLEEEGSEDEDEDEDEEEEEEEEEEEMGDEDRAIAPRKRVSFQGEADGLEDLLDQEEEGYYEGEGGYSDEDVEGDEGEDRSDRGDEEDGYDEEDYYDEEDGGFPRAWEDEEGYDEGQYGSAYYE